MNENIKKLLDSQKSEFDKRFIKEFINDHNGEWRPLRGLYMEDVFDCIHKYQNNALISYLEEENNRLEESLTILLDGQSFVAGVSNGFNQAVSKQIAHNLSVIAYIQGL